MIVRHVWIAACAAAAAGALSGCVQKAYDRVVVYRVDVSAVPNVSAVGLRGRSEPLSWDKDLPLQPRADSAGVYEAVVTHHTGSLTTEVKFTVNGTFELEGSDNRVVRWPPTTTGNDTTIYRVVFNVR
jgi:putative oxidoreductase